MRDQYIKSGDGFLLVYSITDSWSSQSVTAFHEQIIAAKGEKDKIIPQIPIVVVGNKVRLALSCRLALGCPCLSFIVRCNTACKNIIDFN